MLTDPRGLLGSKGERASGTGAFRALAWAVARKWALERSFFALDLTPDNYCLHVTETGRWGLVVRLANTHMKPR